jgi:hypothetical protein
VRVRKEFQKLVGPEAAAKLLSEPLRVGQFETRRFQFVLILVDEVEPQRIPAIISTVVDTILQHGATVSDITSSLLVALFGVPFLGGNYPEARRGLVDALLRQNGDRIRIAHGQCEGPVGLWGSQERCSYGALIPGFSNVLNALLEAKAGTAVEVP